LLVVPPDDLHEWISFEDPSEERTWLVDATFLLSNWTCIYGRGCKGVLDEDATHLAHGCCSHGAHFIDDDDLASIEPFIDRLGAADWQYYDDAKRNGYVTIDPDSGDRTTRVVDGACVFLNRVGFERGPGCALHQKALADYERPMDWKPDVCWQLPLRLHEHTDESGHVTSTVREWKRRDWGEAGHEFHWWCTSEPDAFVGRRTVLREMRDELVELVGDEAYRLITKELKAFQRRHQVDGTPVPHPAVRRRSRG
jgi:hypothetical protein